uniref:Integrase catalytic domain-containing protein n=1 Tax=Cyprinus carpio carpio TaxID=630221 RepID=A0A9J8DN68_CYPCA
MEKDVKLYVSQCKRCVLSKTPEPEARAPLVSISTTAPLELVCIDFWMAEDVSNKSVDVLVITDHFTKLACAYVCPNQTAKSVARVLWNNYFCIYGFPARIHSDKGANFESSLIAEMLKLSGVSKSHTTPYHPMGNGQTERFNRTLGDMIRSLPPRSKANWPQMLNTLTFSYNCTRHETTGYPPFFLMFGRTPRLPVDVLFESVILDGGTVDVSKYIQSLGKDLREAMSLAQHNARQQQKKQAEHYDRKCKGHSLELGDRVLLANKGEKGKRKLADRWESTVYIVVGKNCSLNTYKIRHPVNGRVKTVHRNLLMPVNFLPLPAWEDSVSSECDLSSICDSSSTDLQKSDAVDRTSQWIADLDVVAGMDDGELKDDVIHSSELEICDHEGEQQTEQVEGAECQDISERMSNPSVSLYIASNDETSLISDAQNEDSVSQTVTPVVDQICDVSAIVREIPGGSSHDSTYSCNVGESGEQQRTRTRFGRLIKPEELFT